VGRRLRPSNNCFHRTPTLDHPIALLVALLLARRTRTRTRMGWRIRWRLWRRLRRIWWIRTLRSGSYPKENRSALISDSSQDLIFDYPYSERITWRRRNSAQSKDRESSAWLNLCSIGSLYRFHCWGRCSDSARQCYLIPVQQWQVNLIISVTSSLYKTMKPSRVFIPWLWLVCPTALTASCFRSQQLPDLLYGHTTRRISFSLSLWQCVLHICVILARARAQWVLLVWERTCTSL